MEISKDLRETLLACDHLKEVHFTATGEHYLGVHELNGEKYGRLAIEKTNKGDKIHEVKKGIPSCKIVQTISRAEILGEGKKSK